MAARRVLLLLGGVYHDFQGFTEAAMPWLHEAGWQVDPTYDLDTLLGLRASDYRLVVSYTSLSTHRQGSDDATPQSLTPEQTAALAAWVRSGGGFLGMHAATVSGVPNVAYRELLGARFLSHPPQFTFTVYPTAQPHPITEGIEAFTVRDEFYVQDYIASLDTHMIAVDRGLAYPMVWSRTEGLGRVAYIAMGHDGKVWSLPPYRKLVLQAAQWASEAKDR